MKIYSDGNTQLHSDSNSYVVLVDQGTQEALAGTTTNNLDPGFLNGFQPNVGTNFIRADQGLDTTEVAVETIINPVLLETQYFIQLDNRFGVVVSPQGNQALKPVAIDDDNIATYIVTTDDNTGVLSRGSEATNAASAIAGPRGSTVSLKLKSSLELQTSTFLFNQLGSAGSAALESGDFTLAATAYRFIDSVVRISGVSTGYTLDIPIRLVKKM